MILLAPVLIDEADNPERVKAPDVAVKFKAPVVWVNPFWAVTVDEAVKVPVFIVDPSIVVLPEESTLRYLVVPALFVTLKISTVPPTA